MVPTSRRRLLAASCGAGLLLLRPQMRAVAEDLYASDTERAGVELMTPDTHRAIQRGLSYLMNRQLNSGKMRGAFGVRSHSGGVAVASLAGLAFMCSGNPPGQGPYGQSIDDCIDFVMRNARPDGYIASPQNPDNMYGHGFATLFLSQAYGMTQRDDIGDALRRSVDLLVKCQSDQGGWRYAPVKGDHDLSLTICQIMALRGAYDAGIAVPNATREKCIQYVYKSQNKDGGFRYTLRGGSSSFPLTGAGLVSLYSAGVYEGQPTSAGLRWLAQHRPKGNSTSQSYFFYGHYYAVQAMWHAGGSYWSTWYPAIRDLLVSAQNDQGTWSGGSGGTEYAAAMACIILQMPNNYLPIFEP